MPRPLTIRRWAIHCRFLWGISWFHRNFSPQSVGNTSVYAWRPAGRMYVGTPSLGRRTGCSLVLGSWIACYRHCNDCLFRYMVTSGRMPFWSTWWSWWSADWPSSGVSPSWTRGSGLCSVCSCWRRNWGSCSEPCAVIASSRRCSPCLRAGSWTEFVCSCWRIALMCFYEVVLPRS